MEKVVAKCSKKRIAWKSKADARYGKRTRVESILNESKSDQTVAVGRKGK